MHEAKPLANNTLNPQCYIDVLVNAALLVAWPACQRKLSQWVRRVGLQMLGLDFRSGAALRLGLWCGRRLCSGAVGSTLGGCGAGSVGCAGLGWGWKLLGLGALMELLGRVKSQKAVRGRVKSQKVV